MDGIQDMRCGRARRATLGNAARCRAAHRHVWINFGHRDPAALFAMPLEFDACLVQTRCPKMIERHSPDRRCCSSSRRTRCCSTSPGRRRRFAWPTCIARASQAAALSPALRRPRRRRCRRRSGSHSPISSRCRARLDSPTWVVLVGQPSAHVSQVDAGDHRHRAMAESHAASRTCWPRRLAAPPGHDLLGRAARGARRAARQPPLHDAPRAARCAAGAGAARRRWSTTACSWSTGRSRPAPASPRASISRCT